MEKFVWHFIVGVVHELTVNHDEITRKREVRELKIGKWKFFIKVCLRYSNGSIFSHFWDHRRRILANFFLRIFRCLLKIGFPETFGCLRNINPINTMYLKPNVKRAARIKRFSASCSLQLNMSHRITHRMFTIHIHGYKKPYSFIISLMLYHFSIPHLSHTYYHGNRLIQTQREKSCSPFADMNEKRAFAKEKVKWWK